MTYGLQQEDGGFMIKVRTYAAVRVHVRVVSELLVTKIRKEPVLQKKKSKAMTPSTISKSKLGECKC